MAESYHTNLINVATSFLKQPDIKITKTSFKESLLENLFFRSLYSLSNTFERFNIVNKAFRVDKENTDKLSTLFITYLSNHSTEGFCYCYLCFS